jgi:outer membrane PBP1 activator LpoA protein
LRAAAFLERSAALTPDPAPRGVRALAAAQAKFDAAAADRACELLATAEMAPLDELQRARVDMLRAQMAFGRRDASQLMLEAAKRLEPLDAGLTRQAYLEAFRAAMFAGRLNSVVGCGRWPRPPAPRGERVPPCGRHARSIPSWTAS